METKSKPCKGTGKAKGHGCGKPQIHRVYGLGTSCGCYRDWLLNTKEGQEKIERSRIVAQKKVQKDMKAKERERKKEITDYKPKLQDKVNAIVRLIDIGQPCLAKQVHAAQIHAGHVYSRGAHPAIKFNLHNIHRQSAQSNHWQSDDQLMIEGLSREYGEEYAEFVGELRQTETLKFSNHEYQEFYKKACEIEKKLRHSGRVFSTTQRIEMRNRVNRLLGIYEESKCVFEVNVKVS